MDPPSPTFEILDGPLPHIVKEQVKVPLIIDSPNLLSAWVIVATTGTQYFGISVKFSKLTQFHLSSELSCSSNWESVAERQKYSLF